MSRVSGQAPAATHTSAGCCIASLSPRPLISTLSYAAGPTHGLNSVPPFPKFTQLRNFPYQTTETILGLFPGKHTFCRQT